MKQQLIADAKVLIQKVLVGEIESVNIPWLRPRHVMDILHELTGIETDPGYFDTNGWQWDYWIYLTIDDTEYCLAGDGYYNDHCTFRKK